MPVNPDGTAVSHTSMTQSSTHYLMDGYSAMMQKGKSFGNKKTQEITTTFEATFKLHKNFNVKADFSYTQGTSTTTTAASMSSIRSIRAR